MKNLKILILILLLIAVSWLLTANSYAEVLDRIVAIVNNRLILLSEYDEELQAARKSDPGVTGEKVLNGMIDRALLLDQAKRLMPGGTRDIAERRNDAALVKEYIERSIRAFIHIPIEEIESYYTRNRQEFGEEEFYEVKDKIEDRLIDTELKEKIVEHIGELRKKAYIRVQLEE
ncbi:MAG: hypothetical protein C4526_10345 [Nitrospiraceae bacterium]|nr:MAG: hypothetical protein C4526_10345 [Nitrospiraceae bacterium]